LNSLPFGALVTEARPGSRPRYWIEDRPLSVVGSATLLAELRGRRRGAKRAGPELVAFGDPQYATRAAGEERDAGDKEALLGPLPFSRDEVKGIASLFPGAAAVRLGRDATKAAVKRLGQGPRYLHFACHALVDSSIPSESALALSSSSGMEGEQSGMLRAWEVFEEANLDAELVVLSACQTGLHQEKAGQGLLGLVRAVQFAGARSVIASLWGVSDRSTAELMKTLYSGLRAGLPRDVALQRAQVSMIEAGGERSHPYRWAAFALMGDGA
jgi:CHAT domain-containing protein